MNASDIRREAQEVRRRIIAQRREDSRRRHEDVLSESMTEDRYGDMDDTVLYSLSPTLSHALHRAYRSPGRYHVHRMDTESQSWQGPERIHTPIPPREIASDSRAVRQRTYHPLTPLLPLPAATGDLVRACSTPVYRPSAPTSPAASSIHSTWGRTESDDENIKDQRNEEDTGAQRRAELRTGSFQQTQ